MDQKNPNSNGKKRILVFVSRFPVLTETFIARDLSGLKDLGNLDLSILYIERGNGSLPESLEEVTYFAQLLLRDVFIAPFFVLFKHFSSFFRTVALFFTLPKWYRPSNLYLFLKAIGYSYVFSGYKPEEIHAHFLSDVSTLAFFSASILDVPFSINAHAKDVVVYPHYAKEKIQRSKFVTLCNKNVYDACLEISPKEATKIKLIYHSFDKNVLFTDNSVDKSDIPMIFMGGTRLVEKKGIEYMINASRELLDRGIQHEVYIAGPGPLYQTLVEKIRSLGLEKNFFILGEGKGLPFDKVAPYYLACDVFVLPIIKASDGDVDGIPNVAIEAAFAGKPIITTNAGSVNELVNHETGIIVPQKDSTALADAIEKLLSDESLRKTLGNAVEKRATELFSENNTVKRLEALLLKN